MLLLVVIAQVVATLVLTGVIWLVQVVHYPLFALVGEQAFTTYESAHSARITALLAGPWAVQGLTTLTLMLASPAGVPVWLVWFGAVLAVVPVVVTLTVSVPAHQVLAEGFDSVAHARLVATNWWRTAAWTAHGAVAVATLVLTLRS